MMAKNRKINVDGSEITVVDNNEQDYIVHDRYGA